MPPQNKFENDLKELAALKIEINRAYHEEDYEAAHRLLSQYERQYKRTHQKDVPHFLSSPPPDTIQLSKEPSLNKNGENGDDGDVMNPPDRLLNKSDKRPSLFMDDETHMSFIKTGIYLGDMAAAVDGPGLAAVGVTHVVDLANSVQNFHHIHGNSMNVHYVVGVQDGDWSEECPSVKAKLIVRVDDTDDAPLQDHFDAINDFMKAALAEGGIILVHCFRGKSRSATSVVQYLMQVEGMDLRSALKLTKEGRPSIQLNSGFKKALMALEKRIWPDREPSIVLKTKSRKPVLSSQKKKT